MRRAQQRAAQSKAFIKGIDSVLDSLESKASIESNKKTILFGKKQLMPETVSGGNNVLPRRKHGICSYSLLVSRNPRGGCRLVAAHLITRWFVLANGQLFLKKKLNESILSVFFWVFAPIWLCKGPKSNIQLDFSPLGEQKLFSKPKIRSAQTRLCNISRHALTVPPKSLLVDRPLLHTTGIN